MDWDKFFQLKAELGRPLVMAHRGASALLPENSPAAFRQAIRDGADIIETDLHITADDQIAVIHDATLARTVEAGGAVRDLTLAQIQSFRLKQPPERAAVDERVMSLPELLELVGQTTPLALELKTSQFATARYAKLLAETLRRHGMIEECAIIGFDRDVLAAVKQVEPRLAAGWITLSNPSPKQPTELLGPFWPLLLLNPFYIKQAHKMGKIVAPLDPVPKKRIGLYLKMGADVLLTDNPKLTLDEIARRQNRGG